MGSNRGEIEAIRKKLESKLEVLHMLDLPVLAHGMVAKLVKKYKRITGSVFWPGDEEAGVVGMVGAREVIKAGKGEKGIEGVDMAVVKSNVVAMLCNTRPVREAIKGVLEKVLTVMVLNEEDGEKVEKKFGENARHVEVGLGPAREPGRERGGRGREREERGGGGSGEGRGKGGRDKGKGGRGEREGESGRGRKRNGLGDGPLHPSWEAARKVKEAKANALQKFQGNKIKFDDYLGG